MDPQIKQSWKTDILDCDGLPKKKIREPSKQRDRSQDSISPLQWERMGRVAYNSEVEKPLCGFPYSASSRSYEWKAKVLRKKEKMKQG